MKTKKIGLCLLLVAALALSLLAGCGSDTPAAVGRMSIDVNPGIDIVFDINAKIVELEAANTDAAGVIGDADYTGADLEETLEALLGRIAEEGYLDGAAAEVMLSVDDSQLSQKMLKRADTVVAGKLAQINPDAKVVSRVNGIDDEVVRAAREQGMTVGKYMLLQAILAEYGDLEWDELEKITLAQLLGYMDGNSLYNDSLYSRGAASSSSSSSSSSSVSASSSSVSVTGRGYTNYTPNDSPNDSPNQTNYTPNDTPYDTPYTPAPTPTPNPNPTPGPGHTNNSPNTPNDSPNTPYTPPTPAPTPTPTPPHHDSPNSPHNSPNSPNDSHHH